MREPTTIVLGVVPPLRGREKLLDLGIRAAHGPVSVALPERRRRMEGIWEFVTSIMAGTALTEILYTSIRYSDGLSITALGTRIDARRQE